MKYLILCTILGLSVGCSSYDPNGRNIGAPDVQVAYRQSYSGTMRERCEIMVRDSKDYTVKVENYLCEDARLKQEVTRQLNKAGLSPIINSDTYSITEPQPSSWACYTSGEGMVCQ